MKIYLTSHACQPNQVRTSRYWVANVGKSKLIHIGVCDIDENFLSLLADALGAKFIKLNIPDDEFKKLMLEEGYVQ